MDSLDLFFKKYSYKFPKGYPDLNNEQDINLLADLLEGLDINLEEEDMNYSTVLKVKEFTKKRTPNRGDVILYKIENQSPYNNKFLTTSGEKELEFISNDIKDIFLKKEWNKLTDNTPIFKDKENTQYKTSDIIKTKEFGGKEKGASLSKESNALNQGNVELQKILTKNNTESINIKVGSKIYKDCVRITNQSGTPKSDFNIENIENTPVVFISHKDGSKPKDFPRWGGFSKYINHSEVADFIKKVKESIEDNTLSSGQNFYKKIDDEDLKRKIVFGKNFGTPNFGIDNVNCVIQGNISFEEVDKDTYVLQGTKIWLNGDIPTGEYEPILMVRYRDGRNDFGIKNCEAISAPLSRVSSSSKQII